MKEKGFSFIIILLFLVLGCSFFARTANEQRRKYTGSGLYMMVCGKIINRDTGKGVPGVDVMILGEGIHRTVSDRNGNFCFLKVPHGEYGFSSMSIHATCPEDLFIDSLPGEITVMDGKNIMNIKIYLKKGGSISGRVFHPDGITPVKRVRISRDKWFYGRTQYVYTDGNGRYEIIGLNSGSKNVLARIDGYAFEARKVDVYEGKTVENVDFILGRGKVSVKGKILSNMDNQEIPKAKIFFHAFKTGENYTGGSDNSNKNGKYSVIGLLGPGKFEVCIIHEEYEILETVVELKPGDNNFDFKLEPEKASKKNSQRKSEKK
ncbi:MAG: hypothetical protein GY757_28395, partial [bacterium]|nr:hypothetical protein [bacterium]